MISTSLTIINKLGLHARAAAKLASTATQFPCQIRIQANGRSVDAKSIMSVMMLAAGKGTEIELHVDGEREHEAIEALTTLINNRFDEAE
jgi:phosphocarrier protein